MIPFLWRRSQVVLSCIGSIYHANKKNNNFILWEILEYYMI